MTEAEKATKKQWEAEHPGERYPANWNLSFDYMAGDDGDEDKLDKSRILSETCTYMETEDETEKDVYKRQLLVFKSTKEIRVSKVLRSGTFTILSIIRTSR